MELSNGLLLPGDGDNAFNGQNHSQNDQQHAQNGLCIGTQSAPPLAIKASCDLVLMNRDAMVMYTPTIHIPVNIILMRVGVGQLVQPRLCPAEISE